MQAKATAKYRKQERSDAEVIGQEEQAASVAQSQKALQDLFKRWNSNMDQASSSFAYTLQAERRVCIYSLHQARVGMQQCLPICRSGLVRLTRAEGVKWAFER